MAHMNHRRQAPRGCRMLRPWGGLVVKMFRSHVSASINTGIPVNGMEDPWKQVRMLQRSLGIPQEDMAYET